MGKYINKGNDGFASIRNSNFVDKSRLIAQVNSVLMTDNRFLCVTRARRLTPSGFSSFAPRQFERARLRSVCRRFGKSVAVKMLNAYYDRSCDSRELFGGLQICEDKDFGKHLNRYPVLYLDMTDFVTKYAGDPRLLDKMKRDIRDELLSLYEGIPTKEDDVLTLLCHLGYLSYNSITKCASIPNYEVRQEFEAAVADTGWAEVMTALQQSEQLMECVLEGEADEVAALVEQVHQQNTSVLRYNNENALACVLSLAFYTARNRYQMVRELPSGKGFADIVLLPLRGVDAPAIVLELKWNQSADTAIAQIKRQEYAGALSAFAGEVLLVGINYNKKTKRHECRIERLEKTQGAAGENFRSSSENLRSNRENLRSKKMDLIVDFCSVPRSLEEIALHLKVSGKYYMKQQYIDPILGTRLLMTEPDSPTSPTQQYVARED